MKPKKDSAIPATAIGNSAMSGIERFHIFDDIGLTCAVGFEGLIGDKDHAVAAERSSLRFGRDRPPASFVWFWGISLRANDSAVWKSFLQFVSSHISNTRVQQIECVKLL